METEIGAGLVNQSTTKAVNFCSKPARTEVKSQQAKNLQRRDTLRLY
ncbi:hypothetical protein [Chroococcidiopsis cubana]|nr:hypothetical protein [Chroococcidiopsis cubana]